MSTLRLAIAQFRPKKGDVDANLARIGAILAQAAALEPPPQIVQFPEAILSGYFVEGGIRESAMTADEVVRALDAHWRAAARPGSTIDVMVGFYERHDGTLYNSALYARLGGADPVVLHVHRKNFLPTYSLFDEERFMERGYDIRAFDTAWGRAAMLVCEDAWHSLTGTIAALDGAQVIFVSAAATARGTHPRTDGLEGPATVARWERLIKDIAEEQGVYCTLANLVGSEGGKLFQGGSLVAGPRGDIRARAPVWDDALLVTELDLDDIARCRADAPMLSDLKVAIPYLSAEMKRAVYAPRLSPKPRVVARTAPAPTESARPASNRATDVLPVVVPPESGRAAPPPLDIDVALVERWLVQFLRDEFGRRGFSKAIVGVSGGVDSAVTTALAVRAFGASNVIGVRLPYRLSSTDSLAHAQLVIDQLGIEGRTLDISAAVDGYLANEPDADAARRGNVMARVRMIALFDLSARYRALPLGTGNKSERLLGYFTWHADDSPPVNPLGDLYKTQVWALARHLGVPAEIIDKPATADLVQGQTDEGDFGITYAKADAILNWLLHGWTPSEVQERGFTAAEVERVQQRLDGTHWKRRLPTVAMLSGAAIGESYLRPVDY
ncbi:MAG: NAD+ synthase [Gemmatimonadaceae bacterium]|nr:NAD+ synthase [Gemmatimonadaceae bacterium]